MPVWMSHPKHGRTPAVGAEIAWNQSHGWTIDPDPPKERNPEQRSAPQVAESLAPATSEPGEDGVAPVPANASPEQLRAQYTAKFGKAPHHRMLPRTILAALME